MARQVLPIVGLVVGAYFGNPQLGYAIGTIVGNAVDPLVVDGPKIGDVAQQTSSEGVYQPIYFGTSQGAGNIIAQGPNVIRRRRQSQGKGGGPVTVTESLYKTFAIRIGVSWRGEEGIVGISRIWENGKLVYDIRENSSIPVESADFASKFRLYLGTDDQAPDPALEAIYGVGNTPSYRGRAYIVFPLYDITQWKAIPQYSFEVVTGGVASPPIQIIAFRQTESVVTDDWLSSPDGIDFSAPWQSEVNLYRRCRFVVTTPDRYIAYGTNNVPAYLKKGTSTWQIASGVACSPVGGFKLAACDDTGQVIVIPGGPPIAGGYLSVSTDYGDSFFSVSVSLEMCTHLGGDFIGYFERKIYSSPSGTGSWALTQDMTGTFTAAFGGSRHSSPTIAMFGGTSAVNSLPAIIHSNASSGFALTEFSFFDIDATYIAAITSKTVDYITTYLVVANNGQMAYRIGDYAEWELSSDRMDVPVWAATSNNQGFAIIGNDSEIPRRGQIKISEDGDTLTTVLDDNTLDGNEFWYQIAALPVSGGEITSEPPTLDQVISAIHEWCGQDASEYDVSTLSDILVRGLILAGPYTGKDAINSLQNLWMIDSPEYERKINYRKRGANVVEQYDFDSLIDEPEEATREQAIEYPKKLHLDYQSPDVDYAPAKATSSRSSIDARVIGEMNVQVPVVLTPTEAFQRANVLHKVSWSDADGEVVFFVPDDQIDKVPGDCISLSLRGSVRRLRITQMEYYPGQIKLTCRGDRQSAYTSNVEGLEPPPPTPPPPSLVGPTMFIVGDWPALRDQDDISTPVKYFAMGGTTEAWRGALGEQSVDLGNTYAEVVEVFSGAIMGTLQEDISDAAPYFADHTNTVVVQLDMDDEQIDALTESQFLNEQGGFALVKSDGTFEIMQYRDAVDMGDGLYELSYLQRGRLDSETHYFSGGDRFVLLSTVAVVPAASSQIGVDMYHRATSFGQTTEDGTVVHAEYEGNSQREWPVANILLERSGDTINGTIVPRHRFGTEIAPVRSINWTNYEITFQDSLDQFQTETQTGDTFSYDASGMAFPITITVYQVNRITGAGPGKSEVIE